MLPPLNLLTSPTASVSTSLISTSWEGVSNSSSGATVITGTQFSGWSLLPVADKTKAAFLDWSSGDLMTNAQGKIQGVQDANGAGQEWLGLTNGVGTKYQSPGIAHNVSTVAGAQYTFTLDYAGQLGLTSANTQIGVYLDGQLLGMYSNTSTSSLNWQTLNFSFKGDGAAHTLSVQLTNGTNTSTARGAMIDALNLVETLPQSSSTVYGFTGSPIALPQIANQLAANDPGLLTTTLLGLPVGAVVSDGVNTATIQTAGGALDLTGWNLSAVTLTVPSQNGDGSAGSNTLNLQVIATSIDPASASMASITENVTVQLLSTQACATPVGVNPYVVYANNVTSTQLLNAISNQIVIASQLVPVSSSYAVPVLQGSTITVLTSDQDGDEELISPVVDLNANPEDFLFVDGNGVCYDFGSGWLSGFLGVANTSTPDAASLCNLSVTLTKSS